MEDMLQFPVIGVKPGRTLAVGVGVDPKKAVAVGSWTPLRNRLCASWRSTPANSATTMVAAMSANTGRGRRWADEGVTRRVSGDSGGRRGAFASSVTSSFRATGDAGAAE